MNRWLLAAMASSLVSATAGCRTWRLVAEVGYTQVRARGNAALAAQASGIDPSQVRADLEDDFGLDDASGSPVGRVELGLGITTLSVSGFGYEEAGTGRLRVPFGDIPVNSSVRTEVRILNAASALTFDVIDAGGFRLSPGLALDYFDLDIQVESTSGTTRTERVDTSAPIPLLFARAELDLRRVVLLVEGGWIRAEVRDFDGTFFDLAATLRVPVYDRIHLQAGYRYIGLDAMGTADDQNLAARIALDGWQVGLGVRF